MSNIAFRDSSIVVVDTARTSVRAGLGLHELLQIPSVEIQARVGVRKGIATPKVTDYVVGPQLDDAIAAGQELDIFWPFQYGDVEDWIQAEALWKYALFTGLHLKRAQNESPVLLTLPAGLSRSAYENAARVFFERFNVASFAILERPTAQLYAANALSGLIVDIDEYHTDITPILDGIVLHPARSSVAVGAADCERYLAHLLRANSSVMGTLNTSASASPSTSSSEASPPNPDLDADLLALARQIRVSGLIKAAPAVAGAGDVFESEDGVTDIAAIVVAGKEKAVIESGMKKKQNKTATAQELARAREIEALDLVTITFREKDITIGKERHRFCEPLFNPSLVAGMEYWKGTGREVPLLGLQDVVAQAVSLADVDQRQYIYGGLFVTGEVTSKVKGIGIALQTRLATYILSSPDQQNEVQTKYIRTIKVPEYFAEYRETGEGYAAFLGACIVAKITFNDPLAKNFLSKVDYSAKGPHAILEFSPSLL
ncbi:actin-like ATPase domain-containing protein [Punctularia strigosozonata HHB-11173 SS5]|uniref:actin-like ATPase domain-containing protein n=1 Tax=Punctularia strigosozonata (strain HHB-11173) TaxID=741275 RepID=UPI0004418031|nr:actin-like ATPase domain-containing protein [Punctularia strigosozonata HHB-11173 SS5]EIN06159.1 actin-like ATPase domain-containing protein [Punctularia strigosozonata HHB-11173 SS5]